MADVTRRELVETVGIERPHVVILGAGASRAACPEGDALGKKLPVMADFIETLELKAYIDSLPLGITSNNFEDIYSVLHLREELVDARTFVEQKVYDYFKDLRLPTSATIYDYLLLSLRPKDVVATFNWDPFLMQAYLRNRTKFEMPTILFLHGNVGVGMCARDRVSGIIGNPCSKCGVTFEPSRLLYPITEKNYEQSPFIANQWKELQANMASAFMFTVFGYGAPASDVAAIALLKRGWGDNEERIMEEIEFIDIREEEDIVKSWEPFIHTHHYTHSMSFFESELGISPRRTGEAWKFRFFDAKFVENNPVPRDVSLSNLWDWYSELTAVES